MKKSLILSLIVLAAAFAPNAAKAQEFDDYFENKTLRLDYIFAGDAVFQDVFLKGKSITGDWAGRRVNLSEVPVEGNGEITVKDKASGTVIYRNTFSSLFQEWVCEEEAKYVCRSFENTFLVPMPREDVIVTVELRGNRRQRTAFFEHEISPKDILIKNYVPAELPPFKYIHRGGTSREAIDVAIVAEGYTEQEMALFYRDAQSAVDAIFSHQPFGRMRDKFNFIAVAVPSGESGVSIPRNNEWKSTAVDSHFDTFYMERYLTTSSVFKLHDHLVGIPYEHIIILANTDTYGGGGIYNSYTLTTAHHAKFKPVVVHEFGHSFGALGDEYAYNDDPSPMYPYNIEPWEQNITTLVDFESKWKDMLSVYVKIPTPLPSKTPKSTVTLGVFEGGGYSNKGIYRPSPACRMRDNDVDSFCPVCQRAIERMIEFNLSPSE
ncbi:MAG: peptidase M64 [Bacteroidales bacterium]|nr:peptidase M64 [Bacteroidales bacterium]